MSAVFGHLMASDFPPALRTFGTAMTYAVWAGCIFVVALAARDLRHTWRGI